MTSMLITISLAFCVIAFVKSMSTDAPVSNLTLQSLNEGQGSVASCYVGGRRYSQGDVFSRPGGSDCIKYRCNNSAVNLEIDACKFKDRCVPVNSVTRDGCRSLRCTKEPRGNMHLYHMAPTARDKCEVNGRCVQKNTPFLHTNCVTYTCVSTRYGGYNFVPVGQQGCTHNGQCISAGSVTQDGCRSMRCVATARGSRLEPTAQDMCEVSGRCVRKNVPFEHTDCRRYMCIGTGSSGYRFQPLRDYTKCIGDNGTCISPGATFSKWLNGRYYHNCICFHGGRYRCTA